VTEYRTEAARLNAAGQQLLMEKKMKPRCLRQRHRRGVIIALAIAALPVVLVTGSSRAQDIYAYPAKGQSQSQQDRDRYECHSWAVKQTGFDPSRAQAAASDTHAVAKPPPPQGHVVKGAARGAALGAVGGAITGNAGTGAAAGAAMGGLAGGIRRRDQRIQQSQQQQVATQSAANSQQSQRNAYHRAMAACLTGRGYTVN
jgi:Glycine-zipper domain